MCIQCNSTDVVNTWTKRGSYVAVKQSCTEVRCKFSREWCSQNIRCGIPEGNLEISTSLYFTGLSPEKTLRFLKQLSVASISSSTYYSYQQAFLVPAVINLYEERQNKELHQIKLKNTPVILGGDGRCDSPGFSAKYGMYSLMSLDNHKIIAASLVQVLLLL